MTEPRVQDWDVAFDNMGHVPGSAALPAHWAAEAEAYRSGSVTVERDIPYGDAAREGLDIVWPDGPPKGLAVFVHGGYWMRMFRSDWTQFAEGARARGFAVALPSYTLAPDARISRMTQQITRALTCAAERVEGPIHLAGHSAGGHLVVRQICEDSGLSDPVKARVKTVVSISGLHDLRPLLNTRMNDTLHLDMREATQESVALLRPQTQARICAWVGGGERPEFIRQAQLLDVMWQGLNARISHQIDSVHHHFSVLEGLKDPDSGLVQEWCGDI